MSWPPNAPPVSGERCLIDKIAPLNRPHAQILSPRGPILLRLRWISLRLASVSTYPAKCLRTVLRGDLSDGSAFKDVKFDTITAVYQ